MLAGSFIACENTNENLVKQRGENVNPLVGNIFPKIFMADDLAGSEVNFDIKINAGESCEKAKIEVSYKGQSAIVLDNISLPAESVNVKLADIATALNVPLDSIQGSDVFSIFVLTQNGGRVTRSKAAFNVTVACGWDPSLAVGSYAAVSEDWETGGPVELVADTDNPCKINIIGMEDVEGVDPIADPKFYIEIDPASFEIANVGDAFLLSNEFLVYKDYTFKVVGGSFDSCSGTYTVLFDISVAESNFGVYTFEFSRND